MTENNYVIRVLDSPLDVTAADWNALLALQSAGQPINPFMRHEYLAAMHESDSATPDTGWTPHFFTLWEGESLAAACPLYFKDHSYGEYVFDWAWANAYQQHGLDYYPKALVAPPFTPVPGARLLARNAQERVLLVKALIAWCEAQKMSSLHLLFAADDDVRACEEAGMMLRHTVQFHWSNKAPTFPTSCGSPDVPARDAQALRAVQTRAGGFGAAALSPEGASVRPDPSTGSGQGTQSVSKDAPAAWQSQIRGPYLKNPADAVDAVAETLIGDSSSQAAGFASFDDFLMSLSQEKRKKIRQERRKVADAGITFRWSLGTDISDADWDLFYRCYAQTYYEHGNAPYLSRDFFARMQRTMPENWLMFVAEHSSADGEKIAIATSLIAISARQMGATGQFYSKTAGLTAYGRYWGALARVDCLHFEACYYQPLQWCIDHGFERFEGGAQGEHKMARALLPVKTTSAHWLAHPAFADAVERFLEREGAGIDSYMNELEKRSPLRQAAAVQAGLPALTNPPPAGATL